MKVNDALGYLTNDLRSIDVALEKSNESTVPSLKLPTETKAGIETEVTFASAVTTKSSAEAKAAAEKGANWVKVPSVTEANLSKFTAVTPVPDWV